MNRDHYMKLRRIFRDAGEWQSLQFCGVSPSAPRLARVHSNINERVRLAAALDAADEGGVITVRKAGTDCDGYKFHNEQRRPRMSLVAEWAEAEATYHAADGPMSISYG